jgi:NADP-dependent 3-hydroxy acid dehydrogenase YdfG
VDNKYTTIIMLQKWRKVVNVNTMGTLNVTSVIFPLMASRKFGHLVNISSVCVSWFGLVVMIAIMDIL